ncbi:MAG: multiheme c-type cytochrome [Phycisphaerales bacterium]
MHRATRRAYASTVVLGSGAAALLLAAGLTASSPAPLVPLAGSDGLHKLDPTNTYLGNEGCGGNGCHSGKVEDRGGRKIGDENKIWSSKDPHAKAFRSLTNDEGKKIAKAMNITDAATDAKCTVCHATAVPEKQRGPKFAKDLGKEGVTCESCHGAAGQWNDPHQKIGWTDEQRKSPGALAKLGMIDTFDLSIRAEMCVSCHLQIDKAMIDAGHPALDFEMYGYNNYKFDSKYNIHWGEHGGPGRRAQLWAVGQIAGARAASGGAVSPALAKVYETGKGIVKDKFGSDDMATIAKAEPDAGKIKAALEALVASAGEHAAGKDHEKARQVITSGVDALVNATMTGDPPDAYYDAIDGALKAEGDAWTAAIKKAAGFAK